MALSICTKPEDDRNIKILRDNHVKIVSMVREFLAKEAQKLVERAKANEVKIKFK